MTLFLLYSLVTAESLDKLSIILVFFQPRNEKILVQLDELDELDRITHAPITDSHKHRKHSGKMVKVPDC